MTNENEKITVSFGKSTGYIYYSESSLLKQLRFYPWVQFVIIFLFLMVAYFLFSSFRKAEQNQVWAGMAKETAQLVGIFAAGVLVCTCYGCCGALRSPRRFPRAGVLRSESVRSSEAVDPAGTSQRRHHS